MRGDFGHWGADVDEILGRVLATATRMVGWPGGSSVRTSPLLPDGFFPHVLTRVLMKAIVIDGYGASDRLQLREVERPEPSAGEVLIRVRAAGVNPIDWKVRRGLLRPVLWLRFPVILGSDVAGVVEAVGPGVTRFRPGDPVFALLYPRRHGPGGYAEYAVARESAVARKPEALSFEEAASLPVAALTALQSLRDLGRLPAGGSALINGASGGVGTFAVQLARALGAARVVGVCGPSN